MTPQEIDKLKRLQKVVYWAQKYESMKPEAGNFYEIKLKSAIRQLEPEDLDSDFLALLNNFQL